jgi:hypothetical protein
LYIINRHLKKFYTIKMASYFVMKNSKIKKEKVIYLSF